MIFGIFFVKSEFVKKRKISSKKAVKLISVLLLGSEKKKIFLMLRRKFFYKFFLLLSMYKKEIFLYIFSTYILYKRNIMYSRSCDIYKGFRRNIVGFLGDLNFNFIGLSVEVRVNSWTKPKTSNQKKLKQI